MGRVPTTRPGDRYDRATAIIHNAVKLAIRIAGRDAVHDLLLHEIAAVREARKALTEQPPSH
jgi:hypothetical protein